MIHNIQTVSNYIEEIEKLINISTITIIFVGKMTHFAIPCQPFFGAESFLTTRITYSMTS